MSKGGLPSIARSAHWQRSVARQKQRNVTISPEAARSRAVPLGEFKIEKEPTSLMGREIKVSGFRRKSSRHELD